MSDPFSNDEKIKSKPPYVPSVDEIFLNKLSEGDRFLVQKMDEVNQSITWVVMLAINTHNNQVDMRSQIRELRERMDRFERANPSENGAFLKWCRENLSGPAKMLFWLSGVIIVAILGAWASSLFPNR